MVSNCTMSCDQQTIFMRMGEFTRWLHHPLNIVYKITTIYNLIMWPQILGTQILVLTQKITILSNILSIIYSCVGIKRFYFSDQGCYELTKEPYINIEIKPVNGWVMQFAAFYCISFSNKSIQYLVVSLYKLTKMLRKQTHQQNN